MKNLFQFAIILSSLFLSTNVFADVKVKIRQTMSGQTFENTTYIKGKRERAEQNMAGTQMVTITQCDLKRSLQLMPVSKTYMVNAWEQASEPVTTTTKTVTTKSEKGGLVTSTVTIKDTGERKQMFGYTARHLIITTEMDSSPEACQKVKSKFETDGWYIDATFALDCDDENKTRNYYQKYQNGCQDRFQTKQIGTGKRGYPLYEKMTMFDENGKETFSTTSEVLEFSKATLSDDLFDVPKDYREIKDMAEMYSPTNLSNNPANTENSNNSSLNQNVQNLSKNTANLSTEVGAKKEGVIRLGLANVKTGSVGEGMNATELATAIQNTLAEYLKGTKIEVVALEAKLPSAIVDEAKSKECDYVVFTNVSHKKGGGGLGMFSKVVAPAIGATGIGHTGSTVGNIAGQVATRAVVSAGNVAGNVKSKDEITIDFKLQSAKDNSSPFAKQYKGKAKSDGEDIISPIIEQAAQAIIDSVSK